MTFDEWLAHGLTLGWISAPVCATHDGIPSDDAEDAEWEKGYDPCQPILRLWNDRIALSESGSVPATPKSGSTDTTITPTS